MAHHNSVEGMQYAGASVHVAKPPGDLNPLAALYLRVGQSVHSSSFLDGKSSSKEIPNASQSTRAV